MLHVLLNPLNFRGTRLAQLAGLWSRWKPVSMSLRVVPSAGTFMNGSHIVAWTPEIIRVGQQLSGASLIQRLGTFARTASNHISSPLILPLPVDISRKWLDVSGGESSSSDTHGTVIVALGSALGNSTGDVTVTVSLDWACNFDGPDLETAGDDGEVQADEAYSSYFTDSTGDWAAGKRLTLKHKEGGGPVPFPELAPEVVYRLQARAKLRYYYSTTDEEGKTTTHVGRITHGVRVRNYDAYPIMAVFADMDSATRYARSGDDAICLPYLAAGDFVSPPNPPWYPVQQVTALKSLGPAQPHTDPASRVARLERLLEQALARISVLEDDEDEDADSTLPDTVERELDDAMRNQGEA